MYATEVIEFTLHFATINTPHDFMIVQGLRNLHYTLLLLIQNCLPELGLFTIYLHYTLLLLIQPAKLSRRLRTVYLHYTLLLLIPNYKIWYYIYVEIYITLCYY